jgi:hypothetical protein
MLAFLLRLMGARYWYERLRVSLDIWIFLVIPGSYELICCSSFLTGIPCDFVSLPVLLRFSYNFEEKRTVF